MPKKIKNPIEVKAIIHFEEGDTNYHIEDVSIHYGMACEHGDLQRKGLPLERNQEVQNIVKDFLEEGIKQAEAHEEIAPEDSLLDADGNATQALEPEPE